MNGPAHYREAERLIEIANRDELGSPEERYRVAAAQVHATLALAAATAWPAVSDWLGDENRSGSDWTQVTS